MSTPADPLVPYASHVVQHMNEDHADSLIAMVKHFTSLTVDQAHLVTLDRLGMDCVCIKDKGRMKCRLPFTRFVHYNCVDVLCEPQVSCEIATSPCLLSRALYITTVRVSCTS